MCRAYPPQDPVLGPSGVSLFVLNFTELMANPESAFSRYLQRTSADGTDQVNPLSSYSVPPLMKSTLGLAAMFTRVNKDGRRKGYSKKGVNSNASYDNEHGFLMLTKLNRDSQLFGGRYRFVRLIGCGTFAQIIEAEDQFSLPPMRRVAIKISQSGMTDLGLQESSLHLALSRAEGFENFNIVQPFSGFLFQGHFCLAMELLPTSLKDITDGLRKFLIPVQQLRKLAWQLCIALAFLSSKGVIHADVRPENVLVQMRSKDGSTMREEADRCRWKIKLADFGNSFFVRDRDIYFDEFNVQTLMYRSPEVLFGLPFDTQIGIKLSPP
jgi:serine/threonine protein kinase